MICAAPWLQSERGGTGLRSSELPGNDWDSKIEDDERELSSVA